MTLLGSARLTPDVPARQLPLPLRFAWRELRAGLSGFYVFVACVALGVMVITGVGALSDALRAGFESQGRSILGGDVTMARSHKRAEPAERAWIAARGNSSETATMRTMARRPDGSEQALAERREALEQARIEARGLQVRQQDLEEQARTTQENAVLLARMLQPRPGERYVLVTSAFHMPRSVATFRHNGFDVIPWPVDYRTRGRGAVWEGFASIPGGLERVDLAFKEWLGLVAYRVSGRTGALWPAAQPASAMPAEGSIAPAPAR